MRRLTRIFGSMFVLAAISLGIAWSAGARPGLHLPDVGLWIGGLWLLGLVVGIPGSLGLLLCLPLEVYDRLPAATQRRLQAIDLSAGGLLLGHLRGVPIIAHWSFLLVLLLASRGAEQFLSLVVALALIVFLHEWGHALLVRAFAGKVTAIELSPLGGVCRYQGDFTAIQDAAVAWGGVLAQGVLHLLLMLAGAVGTLGLALPEWLATLGSVNLGIALFNLLPIEPLDGARAWRLPWLWWWARRGRVEAARPRRLPPYLQVVDDALEQARRDAKRPDDPDNRTLH